MPNLELSDYNYLNTPATVEPAGSAGASGFNPLPYLGKAIEIGTGIWGQKKANEANMELQRRQNQYNLEQWQREMAYNTPKAQYERMKNSGLNPALMYKGQPQNTTKAPMSAPSPKMESITKNMPQLGQFILQSQMQVAQIKNLNAQTARTLAEIPNIGKLGSNLVKQGKQIEQQTENLKSSKIGIEAENRIKTANARIQEKLLQRYEDTGVAPTDSQFLRIFGSITMKVLDFWNNDTPPATMQDIEREFPGQFENLPQADKNLLIQMIKDQEKR